MLTHIVLLMQGHPDVLYTFKCQKFETDLEMHSDQLKEEEKKKEKKRGSI